jgi:hypothetical protein
VSTQVQLRRGTSAQVAAFVGAIGEAVVNTTSSRLVVQDGITAGGFPQARQSNDTLTATTLTGGTTITGALTASGAVTLTNGVTVTGAVTISGTETHTGAVYLGAASVAAAATVDLSGVSGNTITITGSASITSLGTVPAGAQFILRLAANPVFVYNGTSMLIPGGVNYSGSPNDVINAVSLGGGNWEIAPVPFNGGSIVPVVGSALIPPQANFLVY